MRLVGEVDAQHIFTYQVPRLAMISHTPITRHEFERFQFKFRVCVEHPRAEVQTCYELLKDCTKFQKLVRSGRL